MALSGDPIRRYTRLSRMRILYNHGFCRLLSIHLTCSLDETFKNVATDEKKILLHPNFPDRPTDREPDYGIMHQIAYIALPHCTHGEQLDQELFHVVCDILVNSYLLQEA